jgi:hypothetical protein
MDESVDMHLVAFKIFKNTTIDTVWSGSKSNIFLMRFFVFLEQTMKKVQTEKP